MRDLSHVLKKILLDKAGNLQKEDIENLEKKINLEYAKLASFTGFCEVDERYPHYYRIIDFASLKRSKYRGRKLGEIFFWIDCLMYPDLANEDPQLYKLIKNVIKTFRAEEPIPQPYKKHTDSYEMLFWLIVDTLGQLERKILEPIDMFQDLKKLREKYHD